MSVDWTKIEQSLASLFENSSFDVSDVHNKQQQLLVLLNELKDLTTQPIIEMEVLIAQVQAISEGYVQSLLGQLDSAQGLLENVAYTKATIKKDESLKKTLEIELLQLQALNRNLEAECAAQKKERDSIESRNAQLTQELAFETENIARYTEVLAEQKETLERLEEESKDLRTENAKLQTKLKHLEENIEGMKRLKEEHMLSIMQNTETLSKISSGTD